MPSAARVEAPSAAAVGSADAVTVDVVGDPGDVFAVDEVFAVLVLEHAEAINAKTASTTIDARRRPAIAAAT